ncbi:hypothetical protein [uncultured Hyphomonas sp.]|uniref:DODA-type extradiol aromatic ring-opening family dioxygenase n=1 Tax=uncultured Hyphomonas sp. TaxID=225298 RepID=UPI002AAAAECB|nr:hypothetical protein [uncultured Hyphomonas sp.]
MSLVFAGVASHGPGITGRKDMAPPELRDPFFDAYYKMGEALAAARPDAVMIVAAEHFGNFFMNNMPAFAVGMGEEYDGPIEDEEWLGVKHRDVAGAPDLSKRLITEIMQTVDVAFSEEWRFDHGIMVPLNFLDPDNKHKIIPVNINCQGPPLTPLHRAWTFGEAIRRAADSVPERIAVIGTGGISHWPATPDSGKINEAWDREFLDRWARNDKDALLSYTDEECYRDGGQGAFEIRTFITAAAAAGGQGHVHFCEPIPIFATSCVVASMEIV